MPITRPAEVSAKLKTLLFRENGSLHAVFTIAYEGGSTAEMAYDVSPENTSKLIDQPIPQGLTTLREGIVIALYSYLVQLGTLKGAIS